MNQLSLVLLPGLDGTGLLFEPFIRRLPPEIRPIVVSYPPDQLLDYDQLLARVLAALPLSENGGRVSSPAEAAGDSRPPSGRFAILGESFSGPLAVMAAATAPPGLQAVILCASFVRHPQTRARRMLRRLIQPFWFRLVPEFVGLRMLMGRWGDPDLRRLCRKAGEKVPPATFAFRLRMSYGVNVVDELRRCPVPLLYLRAKKDKLIGRRKSQDIVANCPTAKVVELPGPHLLLQTQPEAAVAAMVKFLRMIPSPGAPGEG